MNREELKKLILEQIEAFEKLIEENQDKIIEMQNRIDAHRLIVSGYLQKIGELSKKLRELQKNDLPS